LLDKIEQVVRLIRSKGVGVFFVTQNPLDVPDTVLGQLGNRVQHALRAFTPRDQKAVKAAAETMRANPKFSTEAAITELGVGEALVSFLDEKGRPTVVERAYILPPASRIGPITPEERKAAMTASPVAGVYDKDVDRESAYEKLKARAAASAPVAGADPGADPGATPQAGGMMGGLKDILLGTTGPRGGHREGMLEAMAKSAGRTATTAVTGALVRGMLGSLLGGSKRR
jgi:DNA helicase HerA-like ATPase